MTAHELARKLLAGPDLHIYIKDPMMSSFESWTEPTLTTEPMKDDANRVFDPMGIKIIGGHFRTCAYNCPLPKGHTVPHIPLRGLIKW